MSEPSKRRRPCAEIVVRREYGVDPERAERVVEAFVARAFERLIERADEPEEAA